MFEVYGLGQDFITENTMDGVDPGQNCFNGDELEDIVVMQWTGIHGSCAPDTPAFSSPTTYLTEQRLGGMR